MKRGLLILTFVSVILVGFLHQIGSAFYFYWDTVWFDGVMHYLGALAVGFLFLWTWFVSGLFGRSTPSKREAYASTLAAVMLVAAGWEFFEYAYNISNPVGGNYAVDTFNDFVFGFLGASTAGLIGRFRRLYE